MSGKNEDNNRINVTKNGAHSGVQFVADDNWLEVVDDFVKESGYKSRSAAIRSLVMIGIRSYAIQDPRNKKSITSEAKTESESEYSPPTIRELIPEGKENSVKVPDELLEEVIEDQLLEIVTEDPNINVDGFEVYR